MNLVIEKASSMPLYLQLADKVEQYLIKEKLPKGVPLPSVKEISLRAEVSIETAYKALNELTKQGKCFRRPKKGTYVGDLTSSSARCEHTFCAVYCEEGIELLENNVVNARFYKGITDLARTENMDVLLVTGNLENRIDNYINSKDIDFKGVLTIGGYPMDKINSLAERFPSLPIVHIGNYKSDFLELPENVYGVFSDNYSGAYQMAENFIESGKHKQIAFLFLDIEVDNYCDRFAGYKDALKNAGYPIRSELISSRMRKKSTQEQVALGMEMAKQVMSGAKPTAIMAVNDYLAKGASIYLNSIGMGDKVKVSGFDCLLPEISKEQHFSTVKVQYEKIGSTAVKVLTCKNMRKRKIIKINPQVIIRKKYIPIMGSF